MTHPTDIPSFMAALGALTLGDLPALEDDGAQAAMEGRLSDAHTAGSVVPACGYVLDGLKDHVAEMGLSAARVLAGAAHLVLTNGFLGRATEADGIRDTARARIAELE